MRGLWPDSKNKMLLGRFTVNSEFVCLSVCVLLAFGFVLEPFVGDVFVFMNASSSYHAFQYLGGEESLQATHRDIIVLVK
jgi:hypothetical protein